MLDVVEHEEQALAGQVRGKRVLERLPRLFAHRERPGERGEHELGVA